MTDIAVVPFNSPNNLTGTRDITSASLGGKTPKAAIFFLTNNVVAHGTGATSNAVISIGFAAGAASANAATQALAGSNSSSVARRMTSPASSTIVTRSGQVSGASAMTGEVASLDSFITNGVRINWTSATQNQRRGYVVLICGDVTMEALCGITPALGTSATTTSVTGVGFEPDLVFFAATNGAANNTAETFLGLTFGVALNDGTQKCIGWSENCFVAAGDQPSQVMQSARAACQMNPGGTTVGYTCQIGNFGADGFDVTTNASAGNDQIDFLAIKLGTGMRAALWDFQTPTSTGVVSDTTPGFRPEFGMIVGTALQSLDTGLFNSTDSGGLGIGVFTENDAGAAAWRIPLADPGAAAARATTSQALRYGDGTNDTLIAATLSGFTGSGWELNYSATMAAARRAFALAIG